MVVALDTSRLSTRVQNSYVFLPDALLKFNVIEGRDEKSIKKLLDVAHEAVLKAFRVPLRDRYQIFHQHPDHEMVV
jgi:hypothetical protein